MSERSDRPTLHKDLRNALEARPEVIFAYLFGSTVRETTHGLSDVDVGVFVDPEAWNGDGSPRTAADRNGGEARGERRLRVLSGLIDAVARCVAPKDADVVVLNDAPPLLAERVLRDGVLLLSRDDERRHSWVVRTKSRYCDLRFLREMLDASLQERVTSGRFGRAHG